MEHLKGTSENRHAGLSRQIFTHMLAVTIPIPDMTKLSKNHLVALKKSGVLAIYLFGSRAIGLQHPLSDYDYAVLTKNPHYTKGDALYYKLYDILSEISPRSRKNDLIDIIYLKSVGLELCFHVIRYGKLIFDHDPIARLEFEVDVQRRYCDFKPILNEFDQQILESL